MSMAGYTKLFNSILASTIWRSDDKTRLVWITLLAMADKDGIAEGSIPGLADLARVSIEDCELALAELMAPDKYSRTTEFDGRRIEAVDGGWLLLNHAKYRAKMSEDDMREKNRQRQAKWREKHKSNASNNAESQDVTDGNAESRQSRHTEAEAEAEAEAKADTKAEAEQPPLLQIHLGKIISGVMNELGLKTKKGFNEKEWVEHGTTAFTNGFTSDQFVSCFAALRKKHTYAIRGQYVTDRLPDFVKRNKQIDRLPTAGENIAEAVKHNAGIKSPPKPISVEAVQ